MFISVTVFFFALPVLNDAYFFRFEMFWTFVAKNGREMRIANSLNPSSKHIRREQNKTKKKENALLRNARDKTGANRDTFLIG